jgi:hypothetical protein
MSSGTVFRFNRDEQPGSEPTAEELAADPMLRVLAEAPEDDEPLTDEERASIEEGVAAYQRGEAISANEAKRRHGVS